MELFRSNGFERLGCKIIQINFGICAERVANVLFRNGPASISSIVTESKLPTKEVIKAVKILQNHDIVELVTLNLPKIMSWNLKKENIFYLLRKASFTTHIQRKFGNISELIIEQILINCKCTASYIIMTVCSKLCHNQPEALSQTLSSVKDEIKKLVSNKFMMRVPSPQSVTDKRSCTKENTVPPELLFCFPDNLVELGMIKGEMIKANSSGNDITTQSLQDKDVLWGINYNKFKSEWRNQLLCTALKKRIGGRCGEMVGQVFDSLLQEALKKSDNQWDNNLYVSADDAKSKLPNHPYVDQCLASLEEVSLGCVQRRGTGVGGYLLNIAVLIEQIAEASLSKRIGHRFTSYAARIFRTHLKNNMMNSDFVSSEVLMDQKDSDSLCNYLVMHDYVKANDYSKHFGGNKNANAKDSFLTTVTFHEVIDMTSEQTFMSLYNCLIKRERLYNDNASLLKKKEIKESLQQKLNACEGMEDKREEAKLLAENLESCITEADQEALEKLEKVQTTILSTVLGLVDDVFLFEMYHTYFPEMNYLHNGRRIGL